MDRLENQVSDLRYLTQHPVLMDETPILPPQHLRGSPLSAPGDNSALTPTRPPRSLSGYDGDAQQQQPPMQQPSLRQQQSSSVPPQAPPPRHQSSGGARGSVAEHSPAASDEVRSPVAKRKADDEGAAGKQQRSKRNRYISIACNECKRRKIKCNGGSPCQRCGSLGVECLYSAVCCANNFRESEEYKVMLANMSMLQEQIASLRQTMSAFQSGTGSGGGGPVASATAPSAPSTTISLSPSSSIPSLHRVVDHPPHPTAPSFRGPTSTAFSLDVAKNTLHTMGYGSVVAPHDEGPTAAADDGAHGHQQRLVSPVRSNSLRQQQQPQQQQQQSQSQSHPYPQQGGVGPGAPQLHAHVQLRQVPRDPLWEFDKDEMVRLCRLHEEEVGIMYPVLNIETVIAHAKNLAMAMESADEGASASNGSGGGASAPGWDPEEMLNDEKTHQLKAIMCCALVVEEHGHSEKAIQLFESVRPVADRRLMSDPADVSTLPFLALVAGYRFLSNDEVLAWRVMGQVTRLCVELGLHRRDAIMKIPDASDRKNAINTFWSAYVLDRRWSFGTGLPYVVQDNEVDPNLPMPDAFPYLVAMITYSRVGAKVWRLVSHFEPAVARELRREEIESLDREIMNWYHSVPQDVQIKNWEKERPLTSTPSYNLQRLQIWTYLRLNQIRIWLFTPVLHSASSIMGNLELAQKAVDLAKDTIQYLAFLNNTSNIYRKIQVFYHQFLTSAITVLFLASCHAPVQFSGTCRGEFYTALELVKDLSHKSWVSKRLWRTIKSLKDFAPRLGLEQEDPHSVAAMAMAGLATGNPQYQNRSGGAGAGRRQYQHHQTPTPPAVGYTGILGVGRGGPAALHLPPPGPSYPPSSAMLLESPGDGFGEQQGSMYPQQQPAGPDANNGLLISTEMGRIFDGYTTLNGWRPDMPGTTTSAVPPAVATAAAASQASSALGSPANATTGVPTSAPLPPEGPGSQPAPGGNATPVDEVGGSGAVGGVRGGAPGGMPGAFMVRGENVYQHFRDMF